MGIIQGRSIKIVDRGSDYLCARYVLDIQPPFLKKDRERIGGQGCLCMIGAGEQKRCPAGDGAKFPDHKLVVVDGIVVQYIVLFKLSRVIDEVVIYGEIPHKNVGIINNAFQINRLMVIGARINFLWIHGLSLLSKL